MPTKNEDCIASTKMVDCQERIEFWLETIGRVLFSLEGGTGKPDLDFNASLRQTDCSLFSVSEIETNGHWTLRTPHSIRQDHRDSLAICLITKGTGYTFQGTECVSHVPGDIVMYDVARPFGHGFHNDMGMTALAIPRAIFEACIGPWQGFLKLDHKSGMTDCIFQQIRTLLALPPNFTESRMKERNALNTLDVLRSIVCVNNDDLTKRRSSIEALWRAKAHIERYLTDQKLDVHSISQALALSPRQVARIFEMEGVSVTRYIWRRRFEQCREDLKNPILRHIPIGEVAFRWGFKSEAHFSRGYRIHFGETPTETRKETMRPGVSQG